MCLPSYSKQLQLRGLETFVAENIDEALEHILGLIADKSSVGLAGSVSLEQSGIYEKLQAKNCRIFWHSKCESPAEGEAARQNALHADFYLCSANAVTEDGRIVNIDGKGNRLASIAYGPGTVVFLIGKNKLVAGGLDEAFAHIHNVVCPQNARRMKFDLPCSKNNVCADCSSPQRMCNLNLIVDRVPRGRKYIAVLVNQELGH